jgi:hypothetical protein
VQAEGRSCRIPPAEPDSANTYEIRVQVGRPLIRWLNGVSAN